MAQDRKDWMTKILAGPILYVQRQIHSLLLLLLLSISPLQYPAMTHIRQTIDKYTIISISQQQGYQL